MYKQTKLTDSFQKAINYLAYIYIVFPFAIFACGWFKPVLSVITLCILVISLCFVFRTTADAHTGDLYFDYRTLVLIFLIIALWVYFSGIGALSAQTPDHHYRNAIFDILVRESWPVKLSIPEIGDGAEKGLIYYIGFWMPAAVVGKILGLTAGYLFQVIWAILGILLSYYYMCIHLKKISVWPLLAFILFSGLDALGFVVARNDFSMLIGNLELEWWAILYQYSSHTTQLYWVFNQCIYGWLITMMIICAKRNESIVLIWSTALLTSTFVFAGVLPFLVYQALCNSALMTDRTCPIRIRVSRSLKQIFTFQNLVGGGAIGLISFLYIIGNRSAGIITSAPRGEFVVGRGYTLVYLVFFFIEAGVYFVEIYKFQDSNPLYWVSLLCLLVCPWIRVGHARDFCMRASIPALLVLFLLFIDSWTVAARRKSFIFPIMITTFLIGAITPIHEIERSIATSFETFYSDHRLMSDAVPDDKVFSDNSNFSGYVDKSIFFKYFAR